MTSFSVSQDNMSRSLQGAFGAVTIDGKIWNQIALRPVIPIGKISVALDIVFYIDQDGNVHDDEWDFSSGEKSRIQLLIKFTISVTAKDGILCFFKLVH